MAVIIRSGAEWRVVRDVRLRALREAPYAFGSTFADEHVRDDAWWIATSGRLAWFVATDGDVPVGLIAGLPSSGDGRTRDVISLWVAPAYRRAGTAQALVRAVRRWASGDGATALTARVSDRNDPARRLFEKLGFAPTGRTEPLRSDPTATSVELHLALPARLRFAPSPAGDLHVGHVRSAVLTWVLAGQLGGDYFVRFENTDRAKEVVGSRQGIVADLEWLGLLGTTAPRDQAGLTDAHRAALDALDGHLYRDDGAVRFRVPAQGTVEWDDLVRGPVAVHNEDLDDPVLVRSSGAPTFYLASTVDDVNDGITHLVRSEGLVRATAKQVHIWRALGVEPMRVGHVPRVVGAQSAPVRTGGTPFTIRALRERGISAAAVVVYLAMPETASWMSPPSAVEEIVDRIHLRRLPRRPTTFDLRALETLNRRVGARRNGLTHSR